MGEAARIGRNLSSVALATLTTQVLTLFVSIVLARTLGVAQYGIFVFGFAFPSWFLLFVSLGLDSVYSIEVAADKGKAGRYLTTIALLRLPLALVAGLILWVFTSLLLSDPFARTITTLLGIASILQAYAGTFTSVFRAFEKLEFDALVLVVEKVTTTAIILLLLVSGRGLLEISIVYILSGILTLVLSLGLVKRRFVWFSRAVDWRGLSIILRLATPFALGAVLGTFTNSTGPVLLTLLLDPAATGEYNAAWSLVLALLAFLTIYHFVMVPTMSRMNRQNPDRLSAVLQQSQKLAFIFGLPAALGGWLYAEQIMTLFYGEAFRGAASSFQVLVVLAALSTAVLGCGTALSATGRQRYNLYAGIAATATVIGLNFLLIPPWGPVGAASAVLAAGLVGAALRFTVVRLQVARTDTLATYGRTLIAGAAMVLVLYPLAGLPLWSGVALGASIYFVLLFILGGITGQDWRVMREAIRGALFR